METQPSAPESTIIEKAREAFESSARSQDHLTRVASLKRGFVLTAKVIQEKDATDAADVARNLRSTYARYLIEHLSDYPIENAKFWLDYVGIITVFAYSEVRHVIIENPSLRLRLVDFVEIHKVRLLQLIDELEREREAGQDKGDFYDRFKALLHLNDASRT